MTTRTATCACGQLRAVCEGEPVRTSVCHCLDCQRRTGSAFGFNARFARSSVRIEGEKKTWSRVADSGNSLTFHFCPSCGTTLYWFLHDLPDLIAVAAGGFADRTVPPPRISVYDESRRHAWVDIKVPVERLG